MTLKLTDYDFGQRICDVEDDRFQLPQNCCVNNHVDFILMNGRDFIEGALRERGWRGTYKDSTLVPIAQSYSMYGHFMLVLACYTQETHRVHVLEVEPRL